MYYTLMYNLCLCSPVVRKYELGSAQTITRNKRMLTERDFIEKEGNCMCFLILYSDFGLRGSIVELITRECVKTRIHHRLRR